MGRQGSLQGSIKLVHAGFVPLRLSQSRPISLQGVGGGAEQVKRGSPSPVREKPKRNPRAKSESTAAFKPSSSIKGQDFIWDRHGQRTAPTHSPPPLLAFPGAQGQLLQMKAGKRPSLGLAAAPSACPPFSSN